MLSSVTALESDPTIERATDNVETEDSNLVSLDEQTLNEEILPDDKAEDADRSTDVVEASRDDHDNIPVKEHPEADSDHNVRAAEVFEDYLIKDLQLRKSINYSLTGMYNEDYNATKEELSSMTQLTITDPYNFYGYVYINDVSGLQLLTSLEKIEITRAFVPLSFYEVVGQMPRLKTFSFLNSYTAGDVSTISIGGNVLNGVATDRVPFDPTMNLGALGQSQSIETIYVSGSFHEQLPGNKYRVRGSLQTKGLEALASLKHLTVSGFARVDDESMAFLSGLINLETLKLIEIPLKNVENINTVPHSTKVELNWIQSLDYSSVDHPNIINSTFSHDVFVTQIQPYTKVEDKFYSDYNTGIVIPDKSKDVNVNVGQEVELISKEIINNELHVRVATDQFANIKLYNPETNVSDQTYKGFRYSVSYTLESKKKVAYPLLIAEVGEFVSFKLVDDHHKLREEKMILVQIDDNGKVIPPTAEQFGLEGYTIDHWYEDEALTTRADLDGVFTGGTILYGTIAPILEKFTVTFESNGGTPVEPLMNVEENSSIQAPVNPTLEGYEFVGWFTDESLTQVWDFDHDLVTNDMTLYAKWDQIEVDEDIKPPTDGGETEKPPVDTEEHSQHGEKPPKELETPTVDQTTPLVESPKTGIKSETFMYTTILTVSIVVLIGFVIKKYKKQ